MTMTRLAERRVDVGEVRVVVDARDGDAAGRREEAEARRAAHRRELELGRARRRDELAEVDARWGFVRESCRVRPFSSNTQATPDGIILLAQSDKGLRGENEHVGGNPGGGDGGREGGRGRLCL